MLRYILFLLFAPILAFASDIDTPIGRVRVQEMARGLDEPWSIAFASNGYFVTERGGSLYFFADNIPQKVTGVPATQQGGQAGLFDVMVPANFASSGEIYLSYAHPKELGTAVVRAKYADGALSDVTEIFAMNSPSRGDVHFGGRIVEFNESQIYLTIGERGNRNLAQDMSVDNGAVVLINKDGSGYQIVSKGHRNPQGAALDKAGNLFVNEHGAKGGDEINVIKPGANYGWPVISYGLNYNGSKIGEGTSKEGMEQPFFYWDPSIAPSGMTIHSGNGWPDAKGIFFVGSLKFDQIVMVRAANSLQQIGVIESEETGRVRDIREAPDGSIWFLSVNNGAVYRIVKAN